jgi:uncharacterized protein
LDLAENYLLKEIGLYQVRVRHHGQMARIEVDSDDFMKVVERREEINNKLKQLGFHYVTLDLQGYRTGSMNEVLHKENKNE